MVQLLVKGAHEVVKMDWIFFLRGLEWSVTLQRIFYPPFLIRNW